MNAAFDARQCREGIQLTSRSRAASRKDHSLQVQLCISAASHLLPEILDKGETAMENPARSLSHLRHAWFGGLSFATLESTSVLED